MTWSGSCPFSAKPVHTWLVKPAAAVSRDLRARAKYTYFHYSTLSKSPQPQDKFLTCACHLPNHICARRKKKRESLWLSFKCVPRTTIWVTTSCVSIFLQPPPPTPLLAGIIPLEKNGGLYRTVKQVCATITVSLYGFHTSPNAVSVNY